MIELKIGDLLREDVDAVINTVNTVGVMGKGIALQFKKAYPDNFDVYKKACDNGTLNTGQVLIVPTDSLLNPKYIINFPTKKHWKGNSKIEYIEQGLKVLIEEVKRLGIRSVAVPPLGCGLGGLVWEEVYSMMQTAFSELPDVRWVVFEPKGAPVAKKMLNRTTKPKMTAGRAAVIGLINRYLVPGFEYTVSLLEVQKLVYFLTAAGEKMNQVKFTKHHYGPYADVLRHVMERMDGHFITGYGDGQNKPETPIHLIPEAVVSADKYLESHAATLTHFDAVSNLVEGFETPYGMELLSTVHWVAMEEETGAADDVNVAVRAVHQWSSRKAATMKPEHIKVAWEILRNKGWFERRAQV